MLMHRAGVCLLYRRAGVFIVCECMFKRAANAPGRAVAMVTSQLVILFFFFGPQFPFEQPAHSRAADWEIWPSERACSASVCRPMFCASLMDVERAV